MGKRSYSLQEKNIMAEVSNYKPNPDETMITITEAGFLHLKKQIEKYGKGIGLKLSIKKSGCTGYRYDIEIIDHFNEETELKFPIKENFIIAVPKKFFPMLQGTQIDYQKKGIISEFVFNNPNQTATCGCGESFAV